MLKMENINQSKSTTTKNGKDKSMTPAGVTSPPLTPRTVLTTRMFSVVGVGEVTRDVGSWFPTVVLRIISRPTNEVSIAPTMRLTVTKVVNKEVIFGTRDRTRRGGIQIRRWKSRDNGDRRTISFRGPSWSKVKLNDRTHILIRGILED